MGKTNVISIAITIKRTPILSATIHDIFELILNILFIPIKAIIGEYIASINIMFVVNCICWISFVLRVISEAVEKLDISSLEKFNIFLYKLFLKLEPIFEAIKLAIKLPSILEIAPINVYTNILYPIDKIYLFLILSMFILFFSYSVLTKLAPIVFLYISAFLDNFFITSSL